MLLTMEKPEKPRPEGALSPSERRIFFPSGWMNITERGRLTEVVRALMASPEAEFLLGFD